MRTLREEMYPVEPWVLREMKSALRKKFPGVKKYKIDFSADRNGSAAIKKHKHMKKTKNVIWMEKPAEHNYPSAISYLSLIFTPNKSKIIVRDLKRAKMASFKARDIFRASGLALLGISQHQIERNHEKIDKGDALSPILLVRDTEHRKVIIADGYHRLCAVYHYNDNTVIPCKIVDV